MGAITSAVIGAGTALYTTRQAGKQQDRAAEQAQQAMENADPFAPYRDAHAQRLNALTADPSSISDSAVYKARLMAAERAMASQGYTGSGNALVAAADAGASAYQQEFENLAMLSGASTGLGNAVSAYGASTGAMGNANDNYLSSLGGLGNSIVGLGGLFGNSSNSGTSKPGFTNIKPSVVNKVPVKEIGFNTPVQVGTGGP